MRRKTPLQRAILERASQQARTRSAATADGLGGAESASTISQPSHYPQPGVRATELRTGAKRVHSSGAFTYPVAVQHLCYPPEGYPEDCGPGTHWRCACGAVWEGMGISVHKYPQGTGFRRTDVVLGPDYWLYCEGTGTDTEENYLKQQALWDWRPTTDKIYDLLAARLRGE